MNEPQLALTLINNFDDVKQFGQCADALVDALRREDGRAAFASGLGLLIFSAKLVKGYDEAGKQIVASRQATAVRRLQMAVKRRERVLERARKRTEQQQRRDVQRSVLRLKLAINRASK